MVAVFKEVRIGDGESEGRGIILGSRAGLLK